MLYTLPQILERSARKFPRRDAFRCGNSALTFSELSIKSNQLAQFLIKNGIKRGDRVGIFMNRCLDNAIAVYGILKAGAVYVPIDPTQPTERINFLFKDCGIKILISNNAQRRKLKALSAQKTNLKYIIGIAEHAEISTTVWDEIFNLNPDFTPVPVLENDLAYIIYTSGSTGVPKGIMHTHHSGLAYAKLSADLYNLNENDRVGSFPPLHFDASTFGLFSAPLVGATTIIIPEAHTKMPASLSTLIEKEKITVWYSVPLALIMILQNGVIEKRDLSSLRWILYGGEPFPLKHLKKLSEYLPNAVFSNVYGPAEVNQCTYFNFTEIDETEDSVPIGKVWGNTEILVVDEYDELTKPGEIGELLVRSATQMVGYWNQPELTEKSFFRRSFATGFDQIFYRTGDLVRMRPDGELMFLGRKDRQIKIRGYRVELDEIEAAVLTHSEVKEAAVFVVGTAEEKKIHAAVISREKKSTSESDLINHLQKILPKYAIPENIFFSNDFPRTSSGKVNRRALRNLI